MVVTRAMTAVANGIHSISIILSYPARPCPPCDRQHRKSWWCVGCGGTCGLSLDRSHRRLSSHPHCPLSNRDVLLKLLALVPHRCVRLKSKIEALHCSLNVRYWPKTDMVWCTAHVRFRG